MTLCCITHPLPRDGTDFIALLFHSLYKTLVYESDTTNTTLPHIHVESLRRVVAENILQILCLNEDVWRQADKVSRHHSQASSQLLEGFQLCETFS